MNILALDLGTKTGWATNFGGCVSSGVEDFTPNHRESKGMTYVMFTAWLYSMLTKVNPTLVAYEMPHLRGGAAAETLAGFSTRVQEQCAQRGIEYTSVHSATLKKSATGSGRANKGEMVEMAIKLFPTQTIEDDNQADALHMLQWAMGRYDI